jgi:hypothetical protein
MVRYYRRLTVLGVFVFFASVLHAQQGLLQKIQLNDFYRRMQLSGEDTVRNSYCLEPYRSGWQILKKDSFRVISEIGYTLQNNSK